VFLLEFWHNPFENQTGGIGGFPQVPPVFLMHLKFLFFWL
jgi:hypothetical protein